VQYKVPQNIDLEDKIIGPFTMKQFIYLLVAGFIVYGWWNYLSKSYTDFTPAFLLVGIPVGLLGAAFALVKINDRPFELFVLSILKFIFAPKQRIWQKGYTPENVIVLDKEDQEKVETIVKDKRSLDDLARGLEIQSDTMRRQQIAKAPAKTFTQKVVGAFNLSVKDVKSATEKQGQAQGTAKIQNPKS